MKILTVCSSPDVSLEPITKLLEHSGLSKGLNSEEKNQSYEQWHEQVFDAYEQDGSGLFIKQPLSPGKVWQDMAGQLIYANLTKKQWYWSASKAGWLLDFWHELEPQHRFALIYSPPHVGISQCLLNASEQNADVEIVIQNWINYHFELLRFYRSRQDKCILVNYQQCLAYPGEFIQACKQHLSLDFDEDASLQIDSTVNQMQNIEAVLFNLITKRYPEIDLLFQELEASATPFCKQEESPAALLPDAKEQLAIVWQDYRKFKAQHADDIEIKHHLQQELGELQQTFEKESELVLSQLHQLEKELEFKTLKIEQIEKEKEQETQGLQNKVKTLEETKAALEKQKVQETQTLQNEIGKYQQQNKEHETENELMLLQLHQVQEELEAQFLKTQKIETEREKEKHTLQESIKKQQEAKAALEKQKNQETQALQNKVKTLETAKITLEKQKTQETQALQNKVKTLEETKAALEKQKVQETQTLQNEIGKYQQQNKEHETENELMLLQLHQVQEELEHYFIKYQEQEQNVQSNGILAFIEQKTESDSAIQAQLIQVKQGSNGLGVDLINLQWQEQTWPQYHLQIIEPRIIHDQTSLAAIKLPQQTNDLLPLKTWPPQTADESGAYWAINSDLLASEMTHSSFYPEDIAFLHALLKQLPQWLKTLETTQRVKNNDWSEYYQAIEEIKPALENVFKLQKTT